MPSHVRNPPADSWRALVDDVRRIDCRSLIEVLAGLSAERVPDHLGGWGPKPPFSWTIAEIARVSLIAGTDRRRVATRQDATWLCSRMFHLPPDDYENADPEVWLSALAARQIALQQYTPHEMARSLLVYTSPTFGDPLPAPAGLSCPLGDGLKASFVLFVWAKDNNGQVDLARLDQPQMQPVLSEVVSREAIESTARALSVTPDHARQLAQFAAKRGAVMDRYGTDPLAQRPLIEMGTGPLLSPATLQILKALATNDLFFRLKDEQGEGLANALGKRFERYVGEVLRQVRFGSVLAERRYTRADGNKADSIDWLILMSDRIVLVECKAARLKNASLTNPIAEQSVWDATVGKGLSQIEATADAIRTRNPAFHDIPGGLPIFGIVVTLEDLLFSVRRKRESASSVPTRVATSSDIERFAMTDEGQARRVLDDLYAGDLTLHDSLNSQLVGSELERHPLLEEAWESISPLSGAVRR